MGKYLQVVEAGYPLEHFLSGPDADETNRIPEAMAAYSFLLGKGKVGSGGVVKVILAGPCAERRTEDLIDVLRYEHPLGERAEVNALPTPHERCVAEAHHALRELGAGRGWDLEALDAVLRETAARDYRFAGTGSKSRWNPGRTCSVAVEWRTTDRTSLGFTVTRKGDQPRWVPFLTSAIGYGKIAGALGKFGWQDDRHALLWHKNRRDRWRLDVETLEVEFLYAPAEDGNPHGQYQLGKMYLDGAGITWVEQDADRARYWLRKSADQGFARAKHLLEKLEQEAVNGDSPAAHGRGRAPAPGTIGIAPPGNSLARPQG